MNKCNLLLLTALITGIYDIILQWISKNQISNVDWIKALKPYFEYHTPLGAALIAALVGFVSQWIILYITPFPTSKKDIIKYIGVTIIVSGTIGIVMDNSGLFPHLSNTYYKTLGRPRSMVTDAWSGVIVQLTLLLYYFSTK
jgi:hypothetical protein